MSELSEAKQEMLERQLKARGITDERVLDAIDGRIAGRIYSKRTC